MRFYPVFCLVTIILLPLADGKRGGIGSSGGHGGSGRTGGVFSGIKNVFRGGGSRGTPKTGMGGFGLGGRRQGPPMGGSGVGGFPRSQPGWRPPYSGGGMMGRGTGGGLFGGMLGGSRSPWYAQAQRSRFSSSRNKALLSGTLGSLAGAYVGYKVGQAMHRPWNMHNGHRYWYGSRYYQPTMGKKTCVFEIDENTPNWNVEYEDKSRVKEVVFECGPYEHCCEMSCCRSPRYVGDGPSMYHSGWRWWHTLIVIVILLMIFSMCTGAMSRMMAQRRSQAVMMNNGFQGKPFSTSGYTTVHTSPPAYS